jgi:hypothetical protein
MLISDAAYHVHLFKSMRSVVVLATGPAPSANGEEKHRLQSQCKPASFPPGSTFRIQWGRPSTNGCYYDICHVVGLCLCIWSGVESVYRCEPGSGFVYRYVWCTCCSTGVTVPTIRVVFSTLHCSACLSCTLEIDVSRSYGPQSSCAAEWCIVTSPSLPYQEIPGSNPILTDTFPSGWFSVVLAWSYCHRQVATVDNACTCVCMPAAHE